MTISISDHFTYKKLIRFVLPTICMMIITSVYSIVDGFFVSNIAGKNAFAAVNMIMPVNMALGSMGFMFGSGGSALVAMTLGMGKKSKANQYFSLIVYTIVVVGIILSILGALLMPTLAEKLGATDLIIDDCITYGRTLMISNTFFMLQNAFQTFLVVEEKPKMGLVISICAGVMNIIFDILLVYTLKMGVLGAALATAISEITGGSILFIYFLRNKKGILKLGRTKFYGRALLKTCTNGSSEMVSNLSMSIVGMIYNIQLVKIASENGVAAYGVIMYLNFIFVSLFLGFSIGSSPIISYNFGADNKTELKQLLKKCLVIVASTAFILVVISQTFTSQLAAIFVGYDEELMEITVNGLSLYSISFAFCGFNIFSSAFFTALNNGLISATISFARTLVIQVIAVFTLPIFLGLNGIWLSIVAAEVVTLILSITLFAANRKKYGYI